ncbi:pili assembly chaperone, partial [Klebsiella pneumoniae]
MIQKSMAMSGTTANYTLAESLRNMLSNKMFQVFIALLCAALFSSIALAGGDDGALGEIWTQLSEALSGAPGKALAACMLIS